MTTQTPEAAAASRFNVDQAIYYGVTQVTVERDSDPVVLQFSSVPAGTLVKASARLSLEDMNAARKAAGFAPLALWQDQFSDQANDHMPEIPAGFEDVSWCNDMCPAFESKALKLSLWVDHSDPEGREFPESDRFTIYKGTSETGQDDMPLLATSDWSEVIAFLAKRQKRDPEEARAAYLEKLAEEAAEAAANAMAMVIQRALGVPSGDLAAMWFDGEQRLRDVASEYIDAERDAAANEAEG